MSPASTSIQWLESLQLVTLEKLQQVQQLNAKRLDYSLQAQSALGVKIKKGHSCPNVEYFLFLKQLSLRLLTTTTTADTGSFSLVLTELTIATVESSQVC